MAKFHPGNTVQGHFSEGEWYLATVDKDNGDGTYTVKWFDGDESNCVKSSSELKLMRFDPTDQEYHEVEAVEGERLAEEPARHEAELVLASDEDASSARAHEEYPGETERREPAWTLDDGLCLYINLDRRHDRRKGMEELAAQHKWLSSAMTRITAVVGDELHWAQLVNEDLVTVEARIMAQRASNMKLPTIAADPEDCSSHLTLGGCGCALSHRKAWQALTDSKAKWALVMEDDLVNLCQSFDEELEAVLRQLPKHFTVCYLGFHTGDLLCEGEHFEGPLMQQEDGWLAGLWCYLISRSGAELMLRHAVPFQEQVDKVVGTLAVQDGRCYTVPPGQFLAFSLPPEEAESDVQSFPEMPRTEEEMMRMMDKLPEEGSGGVQLFSDIALHDAALQRLSDVCMKILARPDSRTDLNARDASGQTALHAAAWAGLSDVCAAILARTDFVEVNAIDDEGNSALHAAAFKGLTSVCTKILEMSEFTEAAARDCDDRTAASLAEEKGHNELAKMLREHGA
mmetsp:Transcript_39474/g.91635  ORF Transcript_39474/g.91635 Transcript_39474/m.91635 type:complete len:514 (-) Transcript_39474:149-1690(-)